MVTQKIVLPETDNYRLLTVLTTSIILDNRARIVKIDFKPPAILRIALFVVTLKWDFPGYSNWFLTFFQHLAIETDLGWFH